MFVKQFRIREKMTNIIRMIGITGYGTTGGEGGKLAYWQWYFER